MSLQSLTFTLIAVEGPVHKPRTVITDQSRQLLKEEHSYICLAESYACLAGNYAYRAGNYAYRARNYAGRVGTKAYRAGTQAYLVRIYA